MLKVYLMGAGLGNKKYLTLQGKECLEKAEVIIYDALVSDDILDMIPENCLRVYVGKRGGKISTPQGEINRLLVYYAQQNKQVVRLKNGDPLIFGRGREEVEALKEAGFEVEIIPGLSSTITAPLLAGIPLTDKYLSRGFSVITGHEPKQLDWGALGKIDTLVILMGGRNLEIIIQELVSAGKPLSSPIAIIRSSGTPEQKTWIGTLETIVKQTAGEKLSPTVIVIGEVVKLRELFLQT